MSAVDFYAAREDFLTLFEYLYSELNVRVFESYSEPGRKLRRFESLAELDAAFSLGNSPYSTSVHAVLLQLYAPAAGGSIHTETVQMKIKGAVVPRERIAGWGMYQLYLGGVNGNRVSPSHFGHNSEKRARKWESTYPEFEPVNAWNWEVVERVGRQIASKIRRIGVEKVGSRPVLPAASILVKNGHVLLTGHAA